MESKPPALPVMIFDGDCHFCRLWIRRWRQATGDQVVYVPFQEAGVKERFPQISREQFETSVQFVGTDGRAHSGADAVFQSLARNPKHSRWLRYYEASPKFASVTERAYRFVAGHRTFFSWLTRVGWGKHVEIPDYLLTRRVFLKLLAITYFAAFISLWVQVDGLIGSHGIEPAAQMMASAQQQVHQSDIGWDRYHLLPTLCWFDASDQFLNWQCGVGTVLAVLVFLNIAPGVCLFLLWLIYLSLMSVSNVFLGFQWDNLLLETGFLAIFLAPPQLWPRLRDEVAPPRLVLWLLRLLLFRMMFESGCVKLLSGDPSWRNLTALTYHYETQPLPTWIGWYANQLPLWAQKACCGGMFFVELIVPFMLFFPRRIRGWGCWLTVILQIIIVATGNYCFFNLLTIALCVLWLDDFSVVPAHWRELWNVRSTFSRRSGWPHTFLVPLGIVLILISFVPLLGMFRAERWIPSPVLAVYEWVAPFRSVNGYGLFAVMTKERPEIVIEGSNDGVAWKAYEFKSKPGDLKRAPGFVAPHQPRLDWQMWFAALGEVQDNPWLVSFCERLLQGSQPVLGLMGKNPFPDAPPKLIRAMVYDYHFTDRETHRATGEWWRRELRGEYLPPISLQTNGVSANVKAE